MLAVAVLVGICTAATAGATDCTIPLNGTYTAISDGQWAQTRDSYHDEATVTATWNITSTCTTFLDCTGEVSSDQGWTARAFCGAGLWHVIHDVPGWEPCADGTAVTGQQHFIFSTLDDPNEFTGWDKTKGPSGGCGINQWQTVKMPFKLIKIE
ncbi:hypothetical protein [Mycobacterium sp.]|jgi:hypothetical protein|uniref:hypothetical protein n=1 Tax=Mycobacterium sp. TaxID=1785 RepID=UPI003C729570